MAITTKPERDDLAARIVTSEKVRLLIEPLLPEGVSLERVAADVRLALAKDQTGALEKCTPGSVFLAVATIAKWGLSIGETAHLVPFGSTCVAVADYKGLAQLVMASGIVSQVEARCVYAKELFELSYGTTTRMTHRPIGNPAARGEMIGAYAIFRLRARNAEPLVTYLSLEEIDTIRQQHSKQWKKGPVPAWYAQKTCVRMGAKLLPKDGRLAKTMAMFETLEQTDEQELALPDEFKALEGGEAPTAPARDSSWDVDDRESATLDREG